MLWYCFVGVQWSTPTRHHTKTVKKKGRVGRGMAQVGFQPSFSPSHHGRARLHRVNTPHRFGKLTRGSRYMYRLYLHMIGENNFSSGTTKWNTLVHRPQTAVGGRTFSLLFRGVQGIDRSWDSQRNAPLRCRRNASLSLPT